MGCPRGFAAALLVVGVAATATAQLSVAPGDDQLVLVAQGGRVVAVDDLAVVRIERKPFQLRLRTLRYGGERREFHAVRVTAAQTLDIFAATPGAPASQSLFFGPGTAMAAADQYEHLIVTPEAHHYIMYDPDDPRAQRGRLLAERFDGVLELEWSIDRLLLATEAVPVAASEVPALAVVVFGDRNLDDAIDAGELVRFVLVFGDA
jgi:hypothetical protein